MYYLKKYLFIILCLDGYSWTMLILLWYYFLLLHYLQSYMPCELINGLKVFILWLKFQIWSFEAYFKRKILIYLLHNISYCSCDIINCYCILDALLCPGDILKPLWSSYHDWKFHYCHLDQKKWKRHS